MTKNQSQQRCGSPSQRKIKTQNTTSKNTVRSSGDNMAQHHKIARLHRDVFKWQRKAERLFENESRATELVMQAQKLLTRCNIWLPGTR